MEYNLYSKDSAYPCEVTIDEENGRYMIRKADTSGEIFNSAAELTSWIRSNWKETDFRSKKQYYYLMELLEDYEWNMETGQ
ncbi:hypothetical protein [Guptibacillus hwajinpoensis]|uniref:Uncharacterized protein n=2 Tax=Guptibacillus hwajinpoensis TaxID=208199 RepID=A0ABU0K1E3_9BACL|nr:MULTISPECIES: hypothetical protein [Alkalihalobacillus]KMM38381.1 threonine dehydratase [Alkalihalobacillus macyae]MDQ0483163.1 hypothetical protein [Alkalihalobacillus hemicentroti]